MTKNSLMLISLVAAIPGALLLVLMVMAFINYAAGPTMWYKALAGTALLVGLLLTCMPLVIFVRGGPKAEKAPDKESVEGAESEASDSEAIVAESGEVSDSQVDVTDENLEVVDGESDEFAMTGELVAGDSDTSNEDFDLGSDFEIGAGEEEAVEVIDDDDDAPKKKK